MFDLVDLQTFEDGPRVHDLKVAELLKYGRQRDIRQLIERNRKELESYGKLVCGTVPQTPAGGRPSNEYWLSEEQALVLCALSNADGAPSARASIIKVYQAWRKGKLAKVDYNDPKQQLEFILAIAERAEKAEKQLVIAHNKIEEDAPKVDFFDRVAKAKGLIKLQDAGRQLGHPPNLFINWLRKNGYLFNQGRSRNVPRVKYGESGMHLFEVVVHVVDGEIRQQTFMTPKGLQHFAAKGPGKEYFIRSERKSSAGSKPLH